MCHKNRILIVYEKSYWFNQFSIFFLHLHIRWIRSLLPHTVPHIGFCFMLATGEQTVFYDTHEYFSIAILIMRNGMCVLFSAGAGQHTFAPVFTLCDFSLLPFFSIAFVRTHFQCLFTPCSFFLFAYFPVTICGWVVMKFSHLLQQYDSLNDLWPVSPIKCTSVSTNN